MASDLETRIRNVTAVLGPTNTGKTHLAIERMLGHESGMIGLPLRLLAREVYDKIAARIGADKVALVTGEEKIKPERARYWVATVEAMLNSGGVPDPSPLDGEFLELRNTILTTPAATLAGVREQMRALLTCEDAGACGGGDAVLIGVGHAFDTLGRLLGEPEAQP